MLHLNYAEPHHDCGQMLGAQDAYLVLVVLSAMETNSFAPTGTTLINISIGRCPDSAVDNQLTKLKELGHC